jgi:hypothetical protein
MPKIAKVEKEEPKIIVKEKVVTGIVDAPMRLSPLQVLMNEKFPNLYHDTRDAAINSFPNFPTKIKDHIIMQGYAVEDVFTVIENYNNIDKPPRVDIPVDGNFVVTPPFIAPAPEPNQDNTNKNTKSYDKKLVWVGVGLGLGILLLTLNN